MASDIFRLVWTTLHFGLPLIPWLLRRRLGSIYHKWTYQATTSPKNVVVLGGSFAGIELVKRLYSTLPTGYRVILIERNSHFNFTFNFPRFSVLQGREHLAFIPYDGIAKTAPEGIFRLIRGEVVNITETEVQLRSGEKVEFQYLAIATGTSSTPPSKVVSHNRDEGCAELQSVQRNISTAKKIAVVGGGAVGVELAADIKSFYPELDVTLIHSRKQLLNAFGKRLHDHVTLVFEQLGIRIMLNERPQLNSHSLIFSDGHIEEFSYVVSCTGQRPNSEVLAKIAPDSISKETSRILVNPNLQVKDHNGNFSRIFAIGDVAETGGPKMARAAVFQADVITCNILDAINERRLSMSYKPMVVEGTIKLTLGKDKAVIYFMDGQGGDILVPIKGGKEILQVAQWWSMLGADISSSHPVVQKGSLH